MARLEETDASLIRLAQSGDLKFLIDIERKTNITLWSDQHINNAIKAGQVRVYLSSGQQTPCAFLIEQIVETEATLLHLVVSSNYQSQGIGRMLLSSWIESLPKSITTIWLEVRRSNHIAQHLYQSLGFQQQYIRKAYYRSDTTEPKEDALVFCYNRVSD